MRISFYSLFQGKNHFHEEGFYMIIPKYFEDNHIFGVNDEPMRAYYIPTSPAQDPDWKIRTGTAIGNSVILTASMIVRKLFMMKGMTRITSTHFRFRLTSRITATISISIPIHAIHSRLILHMYRTKIHAVLMCTASHIKSRKEPQLTI